MTAPLALGIIRTDLAGNDTRSQESEMRRRILDDGYVPMIAYHTGPIPPDELAVSVQSHRATVVVAQSLGQLGTGAFKAIRGLAEVWLMVPAGEVYRKHDRGPRIQVCETSGQAQQRIIRLLADQDHETAVGE